MEVYRTYGTASDRLALICTGVLIDDFTNPATPTTVTLNWISQGYVDNQNLDGVGGTKPSLTLTILGPATIGVPGFADIWQGGVAKSANALPFIVRSVAPTTGLCIFNVPRVRGVYHFIIVFTKPNGEDTVVDEWDVKVQ